MIEIPQAQSVRIKETNVYIERHDVLIRPGRLSGAVALLKQIISASKYRILTPNIAPSDHLVLELAFQQMSERGDSLGSWIPMPANPALFKQWFSLVLPGGSTTLWRQMGPAADFRPGSIVNRRTFLVEPGTMGGNLVDLLYREHDVLKFEISASIFGPKEMVSIDFIFDSLPAYHRIWGEWSRSERARPVLDKWHQQVEPGGTNEIWDVLLTQEPD